jgi:hypothetical protein
MESREDIYQRYLERLRLKLIAKYHELGLMASGKYEQELEGLTEPNKMIMLGAGHSDFMEHGRGTGYVSPKHIMEWIEVKQGLPQEFYENKKSIAYAIATKIAKEGIRVPNEHNAGRVISEVVDQFLADDINQMLIDLGDYYRATIESDVLRIFENIAA